MAYLTAEAVFAFYEKGSEFKLLYKMKKITIRNFGPIREAEIEMARMNVLVGPQSIGKSCVLKIAAFFSWLEKRIELTQDSEGVTKNAYKKHFIEYFGLYDYDQKDTYIKYETQLMVIEYKSQIISTEWKKDRWNYHRSRISYIPSERNLIATISNWTRVDVNDSLLEYFSGWDEARKSRRKGLDILSSGVQYSYNKENDSDVVRLKNGKDLLLSETSSGFQSLVPLFVHLNYLRSGQYKSNRKRSYASKAENDRLMQLLIDKLAQGKLDKELMESISQLQYVVDFSDKRKSVAGSAEIQKLAQIYRNFVYTKRSDIFLEEPENNLFPPTQVRLIEWLIEMSTDRFRRNSMFIATHSPYVVNCFLERTQRDYKLFIAAPIDDKGMSTIKVASDDDLQQMYDYGVDVFFNYETFI